MADVAAIARFLLGLLCVLGVLLDSFETIVLPRTVKRPIRFTNLYFVATRIILKLSKRLSRGKLRQSILVAYAPLTMIALTAFWAILIVIGYALMESGIEIPMSVAKTGVSLGDRLYFSGTTFFTIGYGDITPVSGLGKFLAVVEGGTGLAFLALLISYVPVFYNAFSRREATLLLLDSKAGSQPTAAELFRRHAEAGCMDQLTVLLKDWELFSAQLLESYLSYPILSFYRSQHDDQSWLKALCAMMDACALVEFGCPAKPGWEARLRFQANATFAMARHLVVDLSYVVGAEPVTGTNRLSDSDLEKICRKMESLGLKLDESSEAKQRLTDIRTLYEPYVQGLSHKLLMDLPPWLPEGHALDNWQTSAWEIKHF
jgi:voltage-gated potassium channel Kch